MLQYLGAFVPVPKIVGADPVWLVATTRYAGRSIWVELLEGRPPTAVLWERLAELLGHLHSAPLPEGGVETGIPAVCNWISDDDDPDPGSPAQVRVLHALRRVPPVREASVAVIESWRGHEIIHGDLKLEHVALDAAGPVLVDLETAGLGWGIWDYAGIVQSGLALHVRGASSGDLAAPTWLRELVRIFLTAASAPVDVVMSAIAVRLVQTVCEWETMQDRPSAQTALLAQLAASIAADPPAAVAALT